MEVTVLGEMTDAHLYSFHPSFAEVPLDLHVDLNVSNVAAVSGRKKNVTEKEKQ